MRLGDTIQSSCHSWACRSKRPREGEECLKISFLKTKHQILKKENKRKVFRNAGWFALWRKCRWSYQNSQRLPWARNCRPASRPRPLPVGANPVPGVAWEKVSASRNLFNPPALGTWGARPSQEKILIQCLANKAINWNSFAFTESPLKAR